MTSENTYLVDLAREIHRQAYVADHALNAVYHGTRYIENVTKGEVRRAAYAAGDIAVFLTGKSASICGNVATIREELGDKVKVKHGDKWHERVASYVAMLESVYGVDDAGLAEMVEADTDEITSAVSEKAKNVEVATLMKLANLTGVSIGWLLDEYDE